jgi:hypothetical protein
MDDTMHRRDGEYIWLRYSTQFTTGERSHSIEIGIPVPIGASAEQRERLLHEAEAGMSELASHVENRIIRMLQQAPVTQNPPSTPSTVTKTPSSRPAGRSQPPSPSPAPAPARAPLPEQPAARSGEVTVPPTRQHIGASMPSSPGVTSDSSGNLPLPQFIQHIKENLGLNPKQAMDLLKVKSLSGVNLREALDQLQNLVAQGHAGEDDIAHPASPTSVDDNISRPFTSPPARTDTSPAPAPAMPAPSEREVEPTLRERPVIFDEEIEPDEVDDLEEQLDDLDLAPALTAEEQERAQTMLNRLREMRGANTVSPGRLQALNNVVSSQISEEQLQALIEGIWGVTAKKKLKVDQAEALISWAKEDDFTGEAEAVLALLEEERYARGNR